MLIAPMLDLASSVQPVPLRFPHLDQLAHQIAPMHRASDLPITIGCTDGGATGLTGAAETASGFSLYFDTSTTVGLVILMVYWTCRLDDELDVLNHIHEI